jgi:glycosyltransferase involved in cell wall biosynthesis
MGRRVLIVTEDPVGEVLGGAAIRSYEMARSLVDVAEVALAAPGTEPPGLAPATYASFALDDPEPLRGLFQAADVVIMRPPSPLVLGWLRRSGARIVFDLCDPLPLNILEAQGSASRPRRLAWNTIAVDHFLDALHVGHHFICASRRQRDLYLGMMLAARLIAPAPYEADPTFRTFIECVPFGIPVEGPERIKAAGPRRRFTGLGEDDQIVLWNGGIWNWLDPVTAVAAVIEAAERNPHVRLVFMGSRIDDGPEQCEARAARELARELGMLDRLVFFNEGFVSYAERATWEMEADCLISTNLDHLESNFSFRTRLLDCFWVGVPAVCTEGDELSDLLERCDGGVIVPHGDVDAVAAGILRVLAGDREGYRDRLLAAGRELVWPLAVEPLKRIVALEGEPRALGDPLARRLSSPVRRGRSAAIRLARSLSR